MTAATYGDMQTRIADELNRSDLTSQIKREIQSAIARYERQRFWFNEGADTASTTASTQRLAVPDDGIEYDALEITYSTVPQELPRLAWPQFVRAGYLNTAVEGLPSAWSYFRDEIFFWPVPDSAYDLTLYYVKQLSALSADGDSNDWMTEGEELIRARARQAVKINYIGEELAVQQAQAQAMAGQPYYSAAERIAHLALLRSTAQRKSVGVLRTELPTRGAFNIVTG